MPNLRSASVEFDLKIFRLKGELAEDDRQCAWELYTEISTRVALVGRQDRKTSDFEGEIYVESLDSLYRFFSEARGIMRKFPVGKINRAASKKNHLGIVIHSCVQHVQRPFLEKWHADVRHWWDFESDKKVPPFQRQAKFPRLAEMQKDWANLRYRMRQLQDELVETYALINVHSKK